MSKINELIKDIRNIDGSDLEKNTAYLSPVFVENGSSEYQYTRVVIDSSGTPATPYIGVEGIIAGDNISITNSNSGFPIISSKSPDGGINLYSSDLDTISSANYPPIQSKAKGLYFDRKYISVSSVNNDKSLITFNTTFTDGFIRKNMNGGSDKLLLSDGSTTDLSSVGKNIGNSNLTINSDRILSQDFGYTHSTNGKPYYITGLMNRSVNYDNDSFLTVTQDGLIAKSSILNLSKFATLDSLSNKADKDASNVDKDTWRNKLGVTDLPSDLVKYKDLEEESSFRLNSDNQLRTDLSTEIDNRVNSDSSLQVSINTKLNKPTVNNTSDYVLMGDGSTKPAGDLGKNIGNTDLTTNSNRTLTQGYSYVHATAGKPYYITGLQDKSADISFNRFRVQDANGQESFTTGIKQLYTNMVNASDSDKDNWRKSQLKSNEGYSSGQPTINAINPPVINVGLDNPQPIVVLGSNLFINTSGESVVQVKRIRDLNGVAVNDDYITLTNNVSVVQMLPNMLAILNNFSNYQKGVYRIKIVNKSIENTSSPDLIFSDKVVSENIGKVSILKTYGSGVTLDNNIINTSPKLINGYHTLVLNSIIDQSKLINGYSILLNLTLVLSGRTNSYAISEEGRFDVGLMNPSSELMEAIPKQVISAPIIVKGSYSDGLWASLGGVKFNSGSYDMYISNNNGIYTLSIPSISYTSVIMDPIKDVGLFVTLSNQKETIPRCSVSLTSITYF